MATNTYVALAKQTLVSSTAPVTFASIPQTYTDLVVVIESADSAAANNQISFRLNSSATAVYNWVALYGNGTSAGSNTEATGVGRLYGTIGWNTGQNTTLGTSMSVIHFMNYSNTTTYKTVLSRSGNTANGTEAAVANWLSTAAVTQIDLYSANNARLFAAGSTFTLYGILAESASGTGSKAIGGTVTTSGGYTYHTFTSAGMFQPTASITGAEVLVVAGGAGGQSEAAGGNRGAGGGAGGVVYASSQSFSVGTNVPAIIGAGGRQALYSVTASSNGTNSTFGALTVAVGGGTGGAPGAVGGSGGGGNPGYSGGAATSGQGYAGGSGQTSAAGGGGGAGAAGTNGVTSTQAGNGGNGTSTYSAWGAATSTGQNVSGTYYYAGGGGGGGAGAVSISTGGYGGGAGSDGATGGNATVNTGGGGGGSGNTGNGGNGGSGIVIVRYTT